MAARVGFEPVTLRTQGPELTTEPPRPTIYIHIDSEISLRKLRMISNRRKIQTRGQAGIHRMQISTVNFLMDIIFHSLDFPNFLIVLSVD